MVDFIFFSYLFHQYHGDIHILMFNKEKYKFAIMYMVIILTVQSKCTNYIMSVQTCIFHRI